MEKEKIHFEIMQNTDVPESILMYLRDDKINRALEELRRIDTTPVEKIERTIKILEHAIELSNKLFIDQSLANAEAYVKDDIQNTKKLSEMIQQPIIPNSIVEGRIEFPNIEMPEIKMEDLMSSNNNMFMGGMR